MKPTLLLYGNCQAAALGVIFAADPGVSAAYDVLHVPSFDDRIPDSRPVGADAIAAASVFFDQHDKAPFPDGDLLPADCVRVSFPSVDLNLLWPLHCVNIYNGAPTPNALWGPFPYGDRVVVDGVKRGLSADEVWEFYQTSSSGQLPNLDRFAQLEAARLRSRDRRCDVAMADYVLETFRTRNLFWCVNHPTAEPLRELCHRLIAAAQERAPDLRAASIDATMASLHPEGPLSDMHAPIHPAIVEHFGLTWYPREGAHFGLREHRLSYDDYFREMIAGAVEVRNAEGQ